MSVVDKPITELEEPEVLDGADQALLDGEQYMREHGWCPHVTDRYERVCIVSALAHAGTSPASPEWTEAIKRLRKALGIEEIGQAYGLRVLNDIPYWNDHVCKSQDEALAVFQKARNLPK